MYVPQSLFTPCRFISLAHLGPAPLVVPWASFPKRNLRKVSGTNHSLFIAGPYWYSQSPSYLSMIDSPCSYLPFYWHLGLSWYMTLTFNHQQPNPLGNHILFRWGLLYLFIYRHNLSGKSEEATKLVSHAFLLALLVNKNFFLFQIIKNGIFSSHGPYIQKYQIAQTNQNI